MSSSTTPVYPRSSHRRGDATTALLPSTFGDRSDHAELWLDDVSDLGDG